TKFARGHLRSYKIEAIVKHIRNALNEGVKELWLTSQDTACYGYDIDTNLPNLLNEILKIKRDFKIRVGMGNPDFIPDFIDELIECFKDERIYRFLHIPIQAGSDNVLKKMRREYTIESFRNIVNKFKQEIPDFTLATDMICGYPEETDEDFEESLKIMNEFRPDVINISKFWSRPGTIAATMLQLPSETIKERSDLMVKLHHKISEENNKKWIGWSGKVLVDDIKKEKSGTVITRNNSYKMIIIKGDYKIGDELNVEVVDSTVHYLIGKVV
ncbi:tRNA (N(6)-L-threonylcarbamoyladenosine(37)-C(2))-methylthiotransferase, partial [archaeon]|nr:tRNA (N(6)-L-threonylcarbamoyladenosine(37)-C(2))-methylthiotransferase [archaeon]